MLAAFLHLLFQAVKNGIFPAIHITEITKPNLPIFCFSVHFFLCFCAKITFWLPIAYLVTILMTLTLHHYHHILPPTLFCVKSGRHLQQKAFFYSCILVQIISKSILDCGSKKILVNKSIDHSKINYNGKAANIIDFTISKL